MISVSGFPRRLRLDPLPRDARERFRAERFHVQRRFRRLDFRQRRTRRGMSRREYGTAVLIGQYRGVVSPDFARHMNNVDLVHANQRTQNRDGHDAFRHG